MGKEEIKAGTYNQYPNKKVKQPKDEDHKGLLDSTKHTTFEGPKLKGMNKPLKPIPVFRQKPGEHKRAFYYRMEQTIQSMKKRASFEEKYKVDVQMDPSGQTKIVDREMDEVEMEVVKKKKKSMAQKVALERDRLKVVEQYRQLKAQ